MEKIETEIQMDDKLNIENIIIQKILSSKEIDLKNISDKNLNIFIEKMIIEADYLKEDWQIQYAVKNIKAMIKSELRIGQIIKDKINEKVVLKEKEYKFKKLSEKYKTLNYLSLLSVVLGVIGLFFAGLIFGGLAILFGEIARREKQRFATLGLIIGLVGFWGIVIANLFSGVLNGTLSNYYASTIIVCLIYVFWLKPKSKKDKEEEEEATRRM